VTADSVEARFVERPNRFIVIAELTDGKRVAAYLPNTGRLTHLATPGRRFILRRDGAPPRTTEYTATRAWDGCWVALEASKAPALLSAWLLAGNPLGDFGTVTEITSEVTAGRHRLDLVVTTAQGSVWVEVKSSGRVVDGAAFLSKTPSARGVAHLGVLAELVTAGTPAAAGFVVQRGDAHRMRVGGDADPAWIEAVVDARDAGVAVLAFGCDVSETDVRITRSLPMEWGRESRTLSRS
jgi:sugar fermentation stimulation protein A